MSYVALQLPSAQSIAAIWLDSTCTGNQVTAWTHDRLQLNSGVRPPTRHFEDALDILDILLPGVLVLLGAHAWARFAPRVLARWPSMARFPASLLIVFSGWIIVIAVVIGTVANVGSGYLADHHSHHDPTHYPAPGNPWPFWRRIVSNLLVVGFVGIYLVRFGSRSRISQSRPSLVVPPAA